MEFIDWLREELNKRDWSQSELARRGNISASMVSMVLSGTSKPGANFCAGVARALNLSPEAVMQQAGILKKRPQQTQTSEFLEIIKLLNEDDLNHLIYIAKALAERKNLYKE